MAADYKIDLSGWKKLDKKLKEAEKTKVRIGVLASKGGSEAKESGITLAELAAIHEYGSPAAGIAERSFIRRTFKENTKELNSITAKILKKIIEDGMPVEKALAILGAWGAAEIQKRVTQGEHIPPPLKPATVVAKNSTRPLVDTKQLINSVSWELEE